MTISFKWSIQKLRIALQDSGKTSVVVQADWFCSAVNENDVVQAAASGTKNFALGDNFTAFSQLTESQVLGWCFEPETITETDREGNTTTTVKNIKADAEAQVSDQITRQLLQKQTEPALPWAQIPEGTPS